MDLASTVMAGRRNVRRRTPPIPVAEVPEARGTFIWKRGSRSGMLLPDVPFGGSNMALEAGRPEGSGILTRRTLLKSVAVLGGVAAAAPLVSPAQDPPGKAAAPPTTVTNPPRDFAPGGPPTTYFTDPDILTVDPLFDALVQPNTPIMRLWTGSLWSEGPTW